MNQLLSLKVVALDALLSGLETEKRRDWDSSATEARRWVSLPARPLTGPPHPLKFVLNFLLCKMRWLDCPFGPDCF